MNLKFKIANNPIKLELEVYNSDNRIPFSINNSSLGTMPTSIYCELSDGNNFIEFWFEKETRKLYEISFVSIQEDSVRLNINKCLAGDEYYECFLTDSENPVVSTPIQILRDDNSLLFYWGKKTVNSYLISKNCALGVDLNNELCSVFLINLSKELIYEGLGF